MQRRGRLGTRFDVTDDGPEQVRQESSHFSMDDVPADAHRITDVRKSFGSWVSARTAFDATRAYDIVLAVYEAMANVVEHAYTDTAPTDHEVFDVHARVEPSAGSLQVTVADHGSWSDAEPGPMRGRGLPLIETLADDLTLSCGADGTEVTMIWKMNSSGGLHATRSIS